MKGFIACIAVLCLLHVSGASTKEESKVFFKHYKIDKGEVINTLTLWKDQVMYAVCQGSSADKNCTVYLESTDQDKNTIQSCDLNLNYSDRFDSSVILANAGNSKAVFAVRDGETKIKLISLNLKGCQVKEASVDVTPLKFSTYVFNLFIFPHENNYDFFFRNEQLCGNFFCKATFDYEGKIVKPASVFPLVNVDGHLYQMALGNSAYLVAESNYSLTNIYLVKDGDNQSNITLYTGAQNSVYFMGLSTAESQFGFCAKRKEKLVCKQYDVDGKTKKTEIEVPAIDSKQRMVKTVDMLNLEKGFLVLTVGPVDEQKEYTIAVARFDEHGMQGKTIVTTVGSKCEHAIVLAKLYKNSQGQYCVNHFCMSTFDAENRSEFSRVNRCFLKTELF